MNLEPRTENHWETPVGLFWLLNNEFSFKWDLCADSLNAKLPLHYSPENTCLDKNWEIGPWLFINPPYNPLRPFMEKVQEQAKRGCKIVALVPIQTIGNKYFDDSCVTEIRVLSGRIKFEVGGASAGPGRFNSILIVFNKEEKKEDTRMSFIEATSEA